MLLKVFLLDYEGERTGGHHGTPGEPTGGSCPPCLLVETSPWVSWARPRWCICLFRDIGRASLVTADRYPDYAGGSGSLHTCEPRRISPVRPIPWSKSWPSRTVSPPSGPAVAQFLAAKPLSANGSRGLKSGSHVRTKRRSAPRTRFPVVGCVLTARRGYSSLANRGGSSQSLGGCCGLVVLQPLLIGAEGAWQPARL